MNSTTAPAPRGEPAFGTIPGGAAAQHLARLMGRGRALEVMLGAADYDAELAERYGWINRALPAAELEGAGTPEAQNRIGAALERGVSDPRGGAGPARLLGDF